MADPSALDRFTASHPDGRSYAGDAKGKELKLCQLHVRVRCSFLTEQFGDGKASDRPMHCPRSNEDDPPGFQRRVYFRSVHLGRIRVITRSTLASSFLSSFGEIGPSCLRSRGVIATYRRPCAIRGQGTGQLAWDSNVDGILSRSARGTGHGAKYTQLCRNDGE